MTRADREEHATEPGAVLGGGVQRVLELARRHLDMELAFLAEFSEGRQVYRGLSGDAASFGFALDEGDELSGSYCRLMSEGSIAHAVPDSAADPALRDLELTARAGIRSYVGVPVRLPDGSQYGSLCTVSHSAQPVDAKDARFLAMLAEILGGELHAERERSAERARLEGLVEQQQLDVALQPIVDIATGRMLGAEALARFPAGFGPPDQVFRAAHEHGVGNLLEWLAAARAVELVPLLGPEAYLAVNLSPHVAIELAERALAVADEVPLDRLVLEITEHAAVDSYSVLRESLEAVREVGLRLAIDDGGAGYASLHHIVELRPDIIKIDRSLVDGLAGDAVRRSVVRAFVTLAGEVDATVVGEGVEVQADLDTARGLGVDAVQGYLIGRPTTDRDEIGRWLARGSASPA